MFVWALVATALLHALANPVYSPTPTTTDGDLSNCCPGPFCNFCKWQKSQPTLPPPPPPPPPTPTSTFICPCPGPFCNYCKWESYQRTKTAAGIAPTALGDIAPTAIAGDSDCPCPG